MKSVSCSKPGYPSITCSKISNIPYNLIFKTKFNDSSILITIISCDYLSSIAKMFSRGISQSDCSIQIKLNYIDLNWKTEEKFNIGSKYQPSVYHNVDNTGIS
jgi:hypothetical protein